MATPSTAAEVAKKLETDPTTTEDILIALSAMKLARFRDHKYELAPVAREMLLPENLRYIGGLIKLDQDITRRFSHLAEIARTGVWPESPAAPEDQDTAWDDTFIRAMHGLSANGGAGWLALRVDLSDRRNLLDVGGGPGTYSIALCQRFPHLRATVWDLPRAVKIAADYVRRYNMSERVSLQPGDWNTDDFGSGYDALLMSNVLHGEGADTEMKLEKAWKALESGGLLIIQDFLIHDDNSGPQAAALFRIMVGAYHQSEMLKLVESARFKDVKLIECDEIRGQCLVTAVKG
jgi:predicted O-methyltransferase YrrM